MFLASLANLKPSEYVDHYASYSFILTHDSDELGGSQWYQDGGEFICRSFFGNEYVRSSQPLTDDQVQHFKILAENCAGWDEVKRHFEILKYKTIRTLEETITL